MTVTRRHGDARRMAREYSGPPLAAVITDAPYPTLNRHRNVGSPSERLKAWFPTLPVVEILEVLGDLGAHLEPGGFVLCGLDAPSWADACRIDGIRWEELRGWDPPVGEVSGLRWRSPLVWAKTSASKPLTPWGGMGYYFRNSFELLAVLQAPGKPCDYVRGRLRQQADTIPIPRVVGGYPTEKPAELGELLASVVARPGGRILDPFAGAGRWLAGVEGRDLELWDVRRSAPALAGQGRRVAGRIISRVG